MAFRATILLAAAMTALVSALPSPQGGSGGGCPDCVSPLVAVEVYSSGGCVTHTGDQSQVITLSNNGTCVPFSGFDLGFNVQSAEVLSDSDGIPCDVIFVAECSDDQGDSGAIGQCEQGNPDFGGVALRCASAPS